MTDLLHVVPDFPLASYTHLIPSLERAHVTTADLLTLDAIEVARRAHLPGADVRRLTAHILTTLQGELGLRQDGTEAPPPPPLKSSGTALAGDWRTISTLDPALDAALGGGIPLGYLTEITGERHASPLGVGKTQLLLTLLLAAQLARPRATAIYISTEHALPTTRLSQLAASHPALAGLGAGAPSLANVLTLTTPDLETQEHILAYQLPVALRAHRPALVAIDSIAANYRAGSGSGPAALALRSASLARTGALLRRLARDHAAAFVVANQVADRFTPDQPDPRPGAAPASQPRSPRPLLLPSSQLLSSQSAGYAPSSPSPAGGSQPARPPGGWDGLALPVAMQQRGIAAHAALALDHQARFFTGWEADDGAKTPALGLTWANQVACRVALVKDETWGEGEGAEWAPRRWRRWMRVVFAAWAAPSVGAGTEFEIWAGGVRAVGGAEA